jgi:hypothetical protein
MTLPEPWELTAAQQVFAVFYAIFFGTMLSMLGGRRAISKKGNKYAKQTKLKNASLNLFDTPNAFAIGLSKNNKPLIREIFAVGILNIFPAFVFATIFEQFHKIQSGLDWIDVILIVWISLAPQWIYRVFYALLSINNGEWIYISDKKVEKDFNDFDLAALAVLWEERNQFPAHREFFYHFAFPFFFYLPFALFALIYLQAGEISSDYFTKPAVLLGIILVLIGLTIFLMKWIFFLNMKIVRRLDKSS